jgi:UDP-glucose 4-epimerase
VACQVAAGVKPGLSIFGTDYPTPDGTGVRDYIHVEDLAAAHLSALDYLAQGGDSVTLNCGYGHGYSVREVIRMVERVNGGKPLPVTESPRRAGDPPSLVAQAARVREVLGWSPRLDDLETIVRSQLEWEYRLQKDPGLVRNG